ncbi:MAG: hypothetical protein ABIB71_01975 [Candidatus Woesearchaeota archaeon]
MNSLKLLIAKVQDSVIAAEYTKVHGKPAVRSKFNLFRKPVVGKEVVKANILKLKEKAWEAATLSKPSERQAAIGLIKCSETLNWEIGTKPMLKVLDSMMKCASALEDVKLRMLSIKIPQLPQEIKAEVEADIAEMRMCYDNSCLRSAVIICGRILETALHRKYFEATGIDALEKTPGIGLGKLIAKLDEKGVKLDPGLTQQIHLINQVRIFSVHTKAEAFQPSKIQTHAMILYTLDTLNKLF